MALDITYRKYGGIGVSSRRRKDKGKKRKTRHMHRADSNDGMQRKRSNSLSPAQIPSKRIMRKIFTEIF